jgi:tripartite-type tricarboxylate transporter receptor subunit TctC
MKKNFIGALAACLLICLGLAAADARAQADKQAFPNKPIRLVVAFTPGGVHDTLARLLQPALTQALGQSVVIENRGGAGGNVAADMVAKSVPDGYTLLFTSSALAVSPHLYRHLDYDLFKDLQPIARLVIYPLVFVVPAKDGAKSMQAFLQAARQTPTPYASPGTGTPNHLAGELLREVSGAQLFHVPYKGAGPALVDLMSGRVQGMFLSVAVALPMVQSGKLRMLAVASPARTLLAPGVPTFAELGFTDFDAQTYSAVLAPAHTPAAVVDKLQAAFTKALAAPGVQARLKDLGAQSAPLGPVDFSAALHREAQRWGALIKKAKIAAD